jgi:hypothetical protein
MPLPYPTTVMRIQRVGPFERQLTSNHRSGATENRENRENRTHVTSLVRPKSCYDSYTAEGK